MKVIQDIELLKKLQEYITFETEYGMYEIYIDRGDCPEGPEIITEFLKKQEYLQTKKNIGEEYIRLIYKTLTTDEAIELLPIEIGNGYIYHINRHYGEERGTFNSVINENPILHLNYTISYIKDFKEFYQIIGDYGYFGEELFKEPLITEGKTLLQAISEMLNYLIDNNLLKNGKN